MRAQCRSPIGVAPADALESVADLAGRLGAPERHPPASARNLFLNAAVKLGARRGVLLEYDPACSELFPTASIPRSVASSFLPRPLHGSKDLQPVDHDTALRALDEDKGSLTIPLPPDVDGIPQDCMVLDCPEVGDELEWSLTQYARAGWGVLVNHLRVYADVITASLAKANEDEPESAAALARTAAKELARATGADLVVLDYRAPPTAPFFEQYGRLQLDSTLRKLTEHSQQVERFGDIVKRPRNRADWKSFLEGRLRRYDLKPRSLIVCPIGKAEWEFGALALLTTTSSGFLLQHEERIARQVAMWLGTESRKNHRDRLLASLNALSEKLVNESGGALADQLVRELSEWGRTYLRPNASVGIIAKEPGGVALADSHDSAIPAAVWDECHRASEANRGNKFDFVPGAWKRHGLASPVGWAEGGLWGHLFAFHKQPLSTQAQSSLREAAREATMLLQAEHVAEEWRQQAGVFRHALLGPIQGLLSNAKVILAECQSGEPDPIELNGAVATLEQEAEAVRRWRETQRAFATVARGGKLDVRLRREPLQPIVERNYGRFLPLFEHRGIRFSLLWPFTGELEVMCDRTALDLALSNVLDNAVKYAFYNREATLGVSSTADAVKIWVEDIGTSVPEGLDQRIYEFGERLQRQDPVRAIHGEGIGLFMALAVAKAHRGTLTHHCVSEGHGEGEKVPHRVRFTLSLPWWMVAK